VEDGAVNVTEPPAQNVVEPPAVISGVDGFALTVTVVASEVALQPLAFVAFLSVVGFAFIT